MKVTFTIRNGDEEQVIYPKGDFNSLEEAASWYKANFYLEPRDFLTVEKKETKKFRVVVNKIYNHTEIFEADTVQEAKDKMSNRMEYLGIPSWNFVDAYEVK